MEINLFIVLPISFLGFVIWRLERLAELEKSKKTSINISKIESKNNLEVL